MPDDTFISGLDGHLTPTAISAWLDGELAPSHREGVQLHLDGCLTCVETAGRLRGIADVLGTSGTDGPPSAPPDRRDVGVALAMAAFDEASAEVAAERRAIQITGAQGRRASRWRTAMASAAALIALGGAVTGGAVLFHATGSGTSSAAKMLPLHQPAAGAGGKSAAAPTTGAAAGLPGALGIVVRPTVVGSVTLCESSAPPTASGSSGGVVRIGPAGTTCLRTDRAVAALGRGDVAGITRRGGPGAPGQQGVRMTLRRVVSLPRHRFEVVVGAVAVGTIDGSGTSSTHLELAGVTPPGYRLLLRAIGR